MNFEDLVFGWRDALLGAVALLALYVFVAMRRLRRLRRAAAAATNPVNGSAGAVDLESPSELTDSAVPVGVEPMVATGVAAYAEASFPWNEPPEPKVLQEATETTLANDRRLQAAEAEIAGLREEVTALRGELAAMREEVKQKVERMQAAHNVAPIYGDAMQMAVAGYDAAAIAERCGVARAEAELVVALIRNREDTEPTMRER